MPEYSGSGFRAHNLYKRLLDTNSQINLRVICSSTEHNSCKKYEYDGFTINRIACKKFERLSSNFFRAIQITSNFKSERDATLIYLESLKNRPDLIHVFGKSYVTATVLDYARRNKIPAIIELCNEMDTPFQFVPFLNRIKVSTKLPASYRLICISEMLKKMALANGICEKNIWCRPNPVDEKRFAPVKTITKMNLRQKLTKFTKDDLVIVYIAKFRPSKNHKFLIDVIEKLPNNFKLIMGGPLVDNGPEAELHKNNYKNIKNMICEKKLEDKVHLFNGFITNMEEYYQMSDVYAFPTLQEALGTPMLEAISSAVPVVANRLKDVTDIWIKDGKNGYLAKMNVDDFAEKIEKASIIPKKIMLQSSAALLKVAGTEALDKQYLNLINTLSL